MTDLRRGWISVSLPVLLASLLIGPFCFHSITETDAGWHLAIGRLIATSGIPDRNALSWTAPNGPWYATSWLFDWLAATLTSHFGVLGLQCFCLALIVATLLGLALACDRVAPGRGAWIVPLVAVMLIPRVTERPDLASRAVLAWTLWLCVPRPEDRPQESASRWRRRLAAVVLIALGSNLHSGVMFSSIALACFCAEAYLFSGRHPRELVLAGAGFLAQACNPGGLFNVAYVIKHLGVQSVIRLQEFEAPGFQRAAVFYGVVLIAAVCAWQARRHSPALLVATLLFAGLGIWALRLMYDFEVVAAVPLALGLSSVQRRWGTRVVAGAVMLALLVLVNSRMSWFTSLKVSHEFNAEVLPVRAARFIRQEHLDGRLFNAFRDGGYLEWALPELPSFQDARVQAWPPEFFAREQAAEKSPEAFRRWLRELGVEWAVASRVKERLAGNEAFYAPDWALVYWDSTSEVFIRRDVERLALWLKRLEYRHFRPYGPFVAEVAAANRDALIEWSRELDRFEETSPLAVQAVLERCAVQTRLGLPQAQSTCDKAEVLLDSDKGQLVLRKLRTLPLAAQ